MLSWSTRAGRTAALIAGATLLGGCVTGTEVSPTAHITMTAMAGLSAPMSAASPQILPVALGSRDVEPSPAGTSTGLARRLSGVSAFAALPVRSMPQSLGRPNRLAGTSTQARLSRHRRKFHMSTDYEAIR